MPDHPVRIFPGSAHPELAKEVADILEVPAGISISPKLVLS